MSKSEIDLFTKIKCGDEKGVRKLLSDQRTRKKININCFNDYGSTPFFVAIDGDNIRGVKRMIHLLLEYDAQINIRNGDGHTVLYHAMSVHRHPFACRFKDSADVINVLLQNGA